MVVGSNWVRGWAGLRVIFASGTCWMSPSRTFLGRGSGTIDTSLLTADGIKASRPLPSAFLTTFDHLPG